MTGPKSVPDGPLLFCVFIIISTVKDGNFRLWRNALQLGARLDGDGLAESRRDGARLLNHRDNGGGLGHAENSAGLRPPPLSRWFRSHRDNGGGLGHAENSAGLAGTHHLICQHLTFAPVSATSRSCSANRPAPLA